MNRDEIRTLFDAYFEDYNTGDYEMALNNHYTEDAVFENTRVEVRGRDNIIEWFTKSHALGYKEILTPVSMVIGEDGIAVELAQQFHALEDVPNHYVSTLQKGESIKTQGVAAVYRLRERKIASVRVYCTLSAYNPRVFGEGVTAPITENGD